MICPGPSVVDDIEYKICIYPKINNVQIEAQILFDDKQTKEEFVTSEYAFCRDAFCKYSAAITVADRKAKEEELNACRVLHASNKGYAATKNKRIWRYSRDPLQPKSPPSPHMPPPTSPRPRAA